MQEPWGSSTVNTEEILSGLCFSFALSDAKTLTGREKKKKKNKGGVGEPLPDRAAPVHLIRHAKWAVYVLTFWESNPQSKLLIPSFLAGNWCVFFSAEWGQQGCTAAAILCVCRSPVSSSLRPFHFPPLSPLFFSNPGAEGEEWMTFSCLRFLCQKISKRHSSSLSGYNQSIPGHNKLGPIKS